MQRKLFVQEMWWLRERLRYLGIYLIYLFPCQLMELFNHSSQCSQHLKHQGTIIGSKDLMMFNS